MKRFIILTAFLILLFGKANYAQSTSATLTGLVTDQNGAVISGATVIATNKATNLSRTVSTNGEGVYVFTTLRVGMYEIDITAKGFRQLKITSIALSVGQTISVNGNLEVAGVEVIACELVGEIPLVETSTSKIDAVINDKEIENLPLNGRNFLELALLTPGNSLAPNYDPTKTYLRICN